MGSRMSKKTFTSKEFLALIGKSATAKGLMPNEMFALVQLAMNPESSKAQKVYQILVEEQKRNEHADKKFVELGQKVMDDMQAGIAGIKVTTQKEKLEKLQKGVRNAEDQAAEELLRALE